MTVAASPTSRLARPLAEAGLQRVNSRSTAWTATASGRSRAAATSRRCSRTSTQLVTVAEMRARLAPMLVEAEPALEPDLGPARYVAACHDPSLRVGFISGG